jgi:hypothetical protein
MGVANAEKNTTRRHCMGRNAWADEKEAPGKNINPW